MEAATALFTAISALLWPLIAAAILIAFYKPVSALISSARSRKFTIKIGGQELSMDEASEQQRALIADLQAQIADIRSHLGMTKPVQALAEPKLTTFRLRELSSVLWVDDEPKNNSYFIEQLQRLGVRVDLARTTSEGLSMMNRRVYSVIISDMARREDGKDNFHAGLDLLTAVRERDKKIPFIFYSSPRAVADKGDEALRLGANGITASATELFALLNLEQLKASTAK